MITKVQALIAGSATVAALCFAPAAHADGDVSPYEESYGDAVHSVICNEIAEDGVNTYSMTVTIKAIANAGHFTYSDAVDVINYAVYNYCPRYWADLVAFGNMARGGQV